MEKDKIKEVLCSLLGTIEEDKIKLYKALIDEKCFDEINNYEDLYFGLIYPFENFISGLIMSEISTNEDYIFIMKESQFIERHFEKNIKTLEGGFACCADKSRAIIKALLNFYKTGERIEFNYNQEYTFHLPKIVFNTHENIIEFYEELKSLFYGDNEKYLKALLSLKNHIFNK